jgi:hypothetical protein
MAAVGALSFTANIAREANLSGKNRVAKVTALVNCPAGERFIAEITLTRSRPADKVASVAHYPRVSAYSLVVQAQGRERFAAGEAMGHAEITVDSHGEITDEQEWTRDIELVPASWP